ncbi:MAG: FdhF/YdeP family oxidoreductase [Acidobacteriota bacterium]
MSHRLRSSLAKRLKLLSPLGLGHTKPKHYRDILRVMWKNRDNLGYGWKVLRKGVCDGCSLGVAGLRDWTIDGVHLCMSRLNLLRLNTMPPLDHHLLEDLSNLHGLSNERLRDLGRLAYPMRRRHGEKGFSRISWEDAVQRIARKIRSSDPSRLAFYLTSRGLTNEVYYIAQKVVRFLGTNNIDNAARICHSPSTSAMKSSLGVAATTCSYKDWMGSDLVVFFGANPANDQPVTMKYLHEAKKRGTRVVLVNPYREPAMERYWIPSTPISALFGTGIADYWFDVTTGGDIAFLYGTLKILLEHGWHDASFVDTHTCGFDGLKEQAQQLDWEELESRAGLPRSSMAEFAELIRDARTGVLVWSMGITQHASGGDGVQMIVNLGLTKGWVGRDNCGLMPIRGHSGVQGGAEMGAYATTFPGGRAINADNAAVMSELYGFEVPTDLGLTAVEMVEAAARGELDLLFCSGGNFVGTLPEPGYVAGALAQVPLRVHQDIILNEQVCIEPAQPDGEVILLPARTRYEQEGGGTQTSTERRVMFSPQIPREVGEAKSEWRVWLELAAAADPERADKIGCQSAQAIREEIARVVPAYNGIQHLAETGDAFQYGGPHLCESWNFPTGDGKAHFRSVPLPPSHRQEGWFEVSTRRGRQFNTLVYADVDPINDAPRDAVLMSAEDAAALHLKQNHRIALVNDVGRFEGRVVLAPMARGNLQVHFPEGNVIVRRGLVAAAGGVPDYNTQVRVVKGSD